MKFGQPDDKTPVHWSLPPDHPTLGIAASGSAQPKVFIGCGKWDIDSWVGSYYPTGTKSAQYLKSYIQLFNSIEVNNTFYRLSRSSMQQWANQAEGSSFLFCPKWSQRVTHLKRLKEVEENTQYFMDSCHLLGVHLGPSLLQLPDNFTAKDFDRINQFLALIPQGFEIFFEFRHKSWFEEPVRSEIGHLLRTFNQGWAITDVATRRDVMHMALPIPSAFIRFNGYNLNGEDHPRLTAWAERIKTWTDAGLQKAYFFCHHQDEHLSPENAQFIKSLLPASYLG